MVARKTHRNNYLIYIQVMRRKNYSNKAKARKISFIVLSKFYNLRFLRHNMFFSYNLYLIACSSQRIISGVGPCLNLFETKPLLLKSQSPVCISLQECWNYTCLCYCIWFLHRVLGFKTQVIRLVILSMRYAASLHSNFIFLLYSFQ